MKIQVRRSIETKTEIEVEFPLFRHRDLSDDHSERQEWVRIDARGEPTTYNPNPQLLLRAITFEAAYNETITKWELRTGGAVGRDVEDVLGGSWRAATEADWSAALEQVRRYLAEVGQ